MFQCRQCGAEFFSPATKRDPVGEYMGRAAYEESMACPECGSGHIDECRRCEICGELVPEFKMAVGVRRSVCEDCCLELESVASKALRDALPPDEFEILAQWLDLPAAG